jgi:hypothetical protein
MGGARMVKEVGELELEDGLPKGKLQEPSYSVNESCPSLRYLITFT